MPIINDKSSIGFQRPKSLVVICWPSLCFLLFFEFVSDLTDRRFSGTESDAKTKLLNLYVVYTNFVIHLPGTGDTAATGVGVVG